MTNPTDAWQVQTLDSPKVLSPYTLQIHHAAQLVALVGNSLLPKNSDDSQSNMEWISRKHALLGRDTLLNQTIRMGLIYHPFELHIFDHNMDSLDNLNLEGRTTKLAINWIRDHIAVLGGDTEAVQPISHFEIPHHPLNDGANFELPNPIYHIEMAKYRSNADLILKEFSLKFEHASDARIWPHHFDSGVYIPLAFDNMGRATHSIGIGFAIADNDVDEYYYYINHWMAKEKPNYDLLPMLEGEGYWVMDNWVGAVLPVSKLLSNTDSQGQHQQVSRFLSSGINASLEMLGLKHLAI